MAASPSRDNDSPNLTFGMVSQQGRRGHIAEGNRKGLELLTGRG